MNQNIKSLAAAVIKHYEGLRLVAYRCPADVWTIGYGSTFSVQEGDTVTLHEAEKLLEVDMLAAYDCIEQYVDVDLLDHEAAALVSLIFNIGCGAFRNSTLCRLLNKEDKRGAAQQFQWWRKAGGEVLPGLVKRRESERRLFVDGQIVF